MMRTYVKTDRELDREHEMTLEEMRKGQEPIWTFQPHGFFIIDDPGYFHICKKVRCTKHLPQEAKEALDTDEPEDDEPGFYPPQQIYVKGGWWVDNLTSETLSPNPNDGGWIAYRDIRPCGVCAFQQGIDKVRANIYKRKLFRAIEKKWITPTANGRCGYAEWSWRKMCQDLESSGVEF